MAIPRPASNLGWVWLPGVAGYRLVPGVSIVMVGGSLTLFFVPIFPSKLPRPTKVPPMILSTHPLPGKSSLLNLLVGRSASIVTPLSGTTRDVIDAFVNLDGMPVVLR